MSRDTDIGGPCGAFPETPPSALLAARSDDPVARARGFATLVGAYWRPVYKCVRVRFRKSNEDAKDQTQAFFAHALERATFATFEPGRARFRIFVRKCLRNFVLNEETARRALKRGGNAIVLSVDFDDAEHELHGAFAGEGSFEAAFDGELAKSLEALAVGALREELEARGKEIYFELFTRYDLADEPERPTYAQLATELGIKTTDVTNHLAFVRRRLRQLVLERLREITVSEEEFRDEARELLGVDPIEIAG